MQYDFFIETIIQSCRKFYVGEILSEFFRIIIQRVDCIVSSRKAKSIILITERRVRIEERELVLKLYIYTGLN